MSCLNIIYEKINFDNLTFDTIKYSIMHFIVLFSFMSVVSIVPGWLFIYDICNVDINVTPYSLEIFVKIIIAILCGICLLTFMGAIFIVNIKCYYYLYYNGYEITATICCNPAVMFCLLVLNTGITYVGYTMLYDLIKIELNVNEKYEVFITILTSFLMGWSCILILIFIICILYFDIKLSYCKTKKNEIKNNVEVIL